MKRLIFTIVLLASFQFVQAQEIGLIENTAHLKGFSIVGNVEEATTLPIKVDLNFLKQHKKMDSVKVLSGLAFMKNLECCDSLKSYTATPEGGSPKYLAGTGTNGWWDAVGMSLPFKTYANVSGKINYVSAIVNVIGGSEASTFVAQVYEKSDDTTYSFIASSNPVNSATIQANINNGTYYTYFQFSSPINITNDILVVVKASNQSDGILLYTTKDGCAVDGSWLIGIKNGLRSVRSIIKDNAFNVEGFLFVVGSFWYDDDILNIEERNIESVKLYPNPVNDNLKIENLDEATNINIYNVVGQVVMTVPSAMGSIDVDMSGLSNGLYFIKMQNGKTVRTEKIQVVK